MFPSISRLAARRSALVALALVVAIGANGCGTPAGTPSAPDSASRLSELLRRGARPGELSAGERGEVERLLVAVLPKLAGPLAGHHWRVTYDDLPEADFVSVDLLRGNGDEAPRAMWFHLFWRGELAAAEREAWALRLGRWPARGIEGHHLFVRLGGVELRAVADAQEYRDPQRIRAVLESFDLDALARL